ncbi:MAG: ribonuclease Z [Arenicella sp.]|jgi:ribonuclease Z
MLKNRKLQIALGLLIAIACLIFVKRGDLSESVYQRVASKRMLNDLTTDLQDGLHLILCGAGAPLPDPERSGPCALVIAGETILVIDAGTGGSRNLSTMQVPQGEIDALLLTHFHSDHIDGLGELAMQRWVNGANTSPLPVYGPDGVSQIVNGFNMAYDLDASYRQAHHGDSVAPLSGSGMIAIEVVAPLQGEQTQVLEKDGLTVTMFTVNHAPISPAVGYRFDYKGRSLVISGDTSKSENLQRISKDVDLLVHEALAPNLVMALNRGAASAGNTIVEKITHDILDYHTSPKQAAEIAYAANVKHLLFYHIVPALIVPGSKAAFLKGVDSAYQGEVTIGQDGTMISLPSDSDKIISSKLL